MSPIRVGLIGLSAGPDFNWAAKAHLPYLSHTPHYSIVALANSSIQSAKAAIKCYQLDANTKAYGSAESLAEDPDVDLVVVSVNVRQHYELAKPILKAGKNVFMEWPIGVNLLEAEELTEIARKNGAKAMVCLQARPSLIVRKIQELVDSNHIGRVVSTTVALTSVAYQNGRPGITEHAAYFSDASMGGNVLTIDFGHFIDTLNYTLGEFSSLHSVISSQYDTLDLLDDAGRVKRSLKKDTPDNILVHGILKSGAVASIHFRSSKPIDGNRVRWLITGSEGEIEICSPNYWQWGPSGMTVRISKFVGGRVEEVTFDNQDEISKLPWMSVNVARHYEAFRMGDTDSYATFEDGVIRHRLLDIISKEGQNSNMVSYDSSYQ